MVDSDEAKDIIEEAHEFLNGDPNNRIQEFLLAKETTEEQEDDDDNPPEKTLDIIEVPLHEKIHAELNGLFVEELYKIVSKTIRNDEKPVSRYNAGNIHRDVVPLQYLPIDDIPEYDLFDPLTQAKTFDDDSYDGLGSADFQALRIRDEWGNMFVAFRKFTRRQIVGSSWKVKLMLSGDEYNKFEDNLFALPEKFDAFLFKDHLFVANQGKFEDIFNYFKEYENRTSKVLDGLEDSEIKIHNVDFFEEAVTGDRSALRKMAVVEDRGLYNELTRDEVESEIEQYNLNVNTDTQEGEWGLILPSKDDKRDMIRLLNDDNLFSESTERRYQAIRKRPV